MQLRHGDLQIIKVSELPPDAVAVKGKVLADGEATGHAHRVDVGDLFKTKDGKLYLKVEKLSRVSHEEHKEICLEKGNYLVIQKRQYSPNGWATVQD